jgi:DNA-binding protein HU-beta
MKKPEVVAAVAEATEQSKSQVEKILDGFIDLIITSVKAGKEISYPGLGKFQVKDKAARVARNPHTGESINVAAKKSVKFSLSKTLKDSVKNAAV